MEAYSVLMSVYYKEKAQHLRLSVRSMLDQTVPPEQFVMVCDGPLTPELDAVIAEYAMQYPELFTVVRMEKNMGIGAALNAGLGYCRNEVVARMDSDDIAVPERMELQLAEMEKYPEVSVVGGQIAEFYSDPNVITGYRNVPISDSEVRKYAKVRNPMNHMTVTYKKTHVEEVGNYQVLPGPGFEDYYLWVSLIANGRKLRNVKEVCCKARADAGQYARRGGMGYFQNSLRVEKLLLKTGQISCIRFCTNVIMWFFGAVLLPPNLRKTVFLKVLRKQTLEDKNQIGV